MNDTQLPTRDELKAKIQQLRDTAYNGGFVSARSGWDDCVPRDMLHGEINDTLDALYARAASPAPSGSAETPLSDEEIGEAFDATNEAVQDVLGRMYYTWNGAPRPHPDDLGDEPFLHRFHRHFTREIEKRIAAKRCAQSATQRAPFERDPMNYPAWFRDMGSRLALAADDDRWPRVEAKLYEIADVLWPDGRDYAEVASRPTPSETSSPEAAQRSPFDMEAADWDSERLDWLCAHITNIDWMRLQNGDNLRRIIDAARREEAQRRATPTDSADSSE